MPRQKELEKHYTHADRLQPNVLSYSDFAKHVRLNTYEELKGDIDRMRH